MGYTHYWKQKSVSPNYEKEAEKAFNEILVLMEIMPKYSETAGGWEDDRIILRGGDGTGEPEINKAVLCFNGDGKKGLDHETFVYEFDGETFDFAFCKTARKPYDHAVCLCLLSLANHINGFEFSSDGGVEDWKPAVELYLKNNGGYMSENLEKCLVMGVHRDFSEVLDRIQS